MMIESGDELLGQGSVHRSRAVGAAEEELCELAVGEVRPLINASESHLRPQQQRNVVWRWQVRRRRQRT